LESDHYQVDYTSLATKIHMLGRNELTKKIATLSHSVSISSFFLNSEQYEFAYDLSEHAYDPQSFIEIFERTDEIPKSIINYPFIFFYIIQFLFMING
jgi:hypothetical protein